MYDIDLTMCTGFLIIFFAIKYITNKTSKSVLSDSYDESLLEKVISL